MTLPTPAVRSALVGLVAVTAVAVMATVLHVAAVGQARREAADTVLRAQATTAAAAVAAQAGTPASPSRIAAAFRAFTGLGDDVERVLTDDAGIVYTASDDDLGRAVDWGVATRRAAQSRVADVAVGRARYRVAAAPVGRTGLIVVTAVRAGAPVPAAEVWRAVSWAVAGWGVLVGLLVVMAYVVGPQAASRLTAFGERIARGETDAGTMRRASHGLGTLAGAFAPVAARLRRDATERAELREHVAALYQVNPHYVVLCTLDGRIVEANPAFYAMTGMPPEAVRGGHAAVLADIFPLEPLFELARRSLAEGAAISGIEYGLVGADDEARPVEVSLRAFHAGGQDAVVIQATDMAVRRRLERRVEAFTDTLDLMVDQRVQQLTAGQQSLRRILDAAGVAVASFDAGGATRRWSGGARALTGRTAEDVPHFAAVTSALGLTDADRAAFTAWFWDPGTADGAAAAPFLAHHALADAATGRTRFVRVAWHKVDADVPGRVDARTLVGAVVPEAEPVVTGDGFAGTVPSPA